MKIYITVTILVVLALGLGFFLRKDTSTQPHSQESLTTNQSPTSTMNATIYTNKGTIELELWSELAPKTVANFQELAESDFYNQVKFHRVIKDFMIQAGDPLTKDEDQADYWGSGGPGYTFEDEIHERNHNKKGTISMANAGPDTNGSQFFINTADNDFLDTKHSVFGKVISGMDVVDSIQNVETLPNDRPVEPVEIQNIEITKNNTEG